jgi:hypothetical protein
MIPKSYFGHCLAPEDSNEPEGKSFGWGTPVYLLPDPMGRTAHFCASDKADRNRPTQCMTSFYSICKNLFIYFYLRTN